MMVENKPKLFVDMDGTLTEWNPIDIPLQIPSDKIKDYINQILYQKGYFKTLKPQKNVVEAIKQIVKEDILEVYILSCVLPINPLYPQANPLQDKNDWLDEQFGELIPNTHRIFVPDGEPKPKHIPFFLQPYDTLLDDYTKNLKDWVHPENHIIDPHGYSTKNEFFPHHAIKLLNPVNNTYGTWKGAKVRYNLNAKDLAETLTHNILSKKQAIMNQYQQSDVSKPVNSVMIEIDDYDKE